MYCRCIHFRKVLCASFNVHARVQIARFGRPEISGLRMTEHPDDTRTPMIQERFFFVFDRDTDDDAHGLSSALCDRGLRFFY